MLRETRIFVHHRIFYSRVRPSPSPHALATDSHAAAAAATLAPTNAKSLRPSATHDRRNGLVRSSSSPFLDDAAIGKVNCACAAWIRRRADRRLPPPRGVRMRRHGLFPAPQPVDLLKFDDKASGLASESEPLLVEHSEVCTPPGLHKQENNKHHPQPHDIPYSQPKIEVSLVWHVFNGVIFSCSWSRTDCRKRGSTEIIVSDIHGCWIIKCLKLISQGYSSRKIVIGKV